jgi:hypothetical protein
MPRVRSPEDESDYHDLLRITLKACAPHDESLAGIRSRFGIAGQPTGSSS